mgnify:CR=1 FL=1
MSVTYSIDSNDVITATFTGTGELLIDYNDNQLLYTYPDNSTGYATVVVIEGYSSIGAYAFGGAGSDEPITLVNIGNSVTRIEHHAFAGYPTAKSNIASFIIPESVSFIGAAAFHNIENLTSITFPSDVTSIEDGVLWVCWDLTSFIIPANVTSIGVKAIAGNSALTSLTFEENSQLTSISADAFGPQGNIPSGLTTIYAFTQLINTMGWTISNSTNPPTLNTIGGQSGITVVDITPPPPDPICFPKGTPVLTNLGPVDIEKLNSDKHTIRGNEIVAITQSRPLQKHIVCFEKDSLSKNVPSQQTLCSMEHKVFYKGEMTKARDLVDLCENVTFNPYNGETLYNVLLKKHDKMMINNLICETLHPENIAAKISQMKDGQKKNKAIQELTKIIKENNVPEYQKLYASL